MSDIRRLVGMKLKNLMEEKEVSQLELSRKTGISQPTISAMLPGMDDAKQYPATSYENILALAKFFNVSVDWLLGNSEYRSTSQSIKIAAKTTGLSDDSIQFLKSLSDGKELIPFTTIIDGYTDEELVNDVTQLDIDLFGNIVIDGAFPDELKTIINHLLTCKDGKILLALLYKYCACDFNHGFFEDDIVRYINEIRFVAFSDVAGHITVPCGLIKYALGEAIKRRIDDVRSSFIKKKDGV